MANNFECWGRRRIKELSQLPRVTEETSSGTASAAAVGAGAGEGKAGEEGGARAGDADGLGVSPACYAAKYIEDPTEQAAEVKKVEDRIGKFKEKVGFLQELQNLKQRPRLSLIKKM